MNNQLLRTASLLGCLLLLQGQTAAAQDSDTRVSLSAGAEFTSGTYGGDVDIEDTYVPFTATADMGRVGLRLTVPYLSVRAPQGTIFDPDGVPIPGTGVMTTESGLGDVIGSMTFYNVLQNRRQGFAMDLTGKVKFATADEDKGLGTGANDYTVQADFFKFADRVSLLGSIGYMFRGDATGVDLDNVLVAAAGVTFKVTPDVRTGLVFDFRESAISGGDSVRELTGFVSRRVAENWRMQGFVLAGFSDSSPDWGAGLQIKRIL
jgi:hypothetical protein